MLKFWFIETLVIPPTTWQTEPWFAGVECYRKWDVAQQYLEVMIEYYQDLDAASRSQRLARWQQHFSGRAPTMPPDSTVCRLVEAKGQERRVAKICRGAMSRKHGALGRARWTSKEKTLYLVSYRNASTGEREFLSRIEWPRLPNGMIGYRTQREALERARAETRPEMNLLRVDATLSERLRAEGRTDAT